VKTGKRWKKSKFYRAKLSRSNNVLQTELGQQTSEASRLRAREQQLVGEVAQLREAKRQIEEELHHLKTQRNVDQLQTKELQEQLEAEAYFSVNDNKSLLSHDFLIKHFFI